MLDTAIIGGGPAALTAALYLARAGNKVQVFERGEIGGELSRIDNIENYPGYHGPGRELATAMREQAGSAGAQISYGECTKIQRSRTDSSSFFKLTIDDESVEARSVLVATGSEPRRLQLKLKKPVSYCALCDGPLVRSKNVIVVGGANSAVQGALYLASIASHVTLVTHSDIKADPYLSRKLSSLSNVTIRENLEPSADYLDTFDYIFVFIGTKPATSWLQNLTKESLASRHTKFAQSEITKDDHLFDANGYILTGKHKRTAHATSIPGLYAAGDVRSGATKQVVTATGDGAEAAIEITSWLK